MGEAFATPLPAVAFTDHISKKPAHLAGFFVGMHGFLETPHRMILIAYRGEGWSPVGPQGGVRTLPQGKLVLPRLLLRSTKKGAAPTAPMKDPSFRDVMYDPESLNAKLPKNRLN